MAAENLLPRVGEILTGNQRFTCNFGFQQPYTGVMSVADNSNGYITAGRNDVEPFDVNIVSKSPPSISKLQTAASNTDIKMLDNNPNPYNNFQTGRTNSNQPCEVWEIRHPGRDSSQDC